MKNKERGKLEKSQNEKQYKRKAALKKSKGKGKGKNKENLNQDFQMWLLINENLAFFIITKM